MVRGHHVFGQILGAGEQPGNHPAGKLDAPRVPDQGQ